MNKNILKHSVIFLLVTLTSCSLFYENEEPIAWNNGENTQGNDLSNINFSAIVDTLPFYSPKANTIALQQSILGVNTVSITGLNGLQNQNLKLVIGEPIMVGTYNSNSHNIKLIHTSLTDGKNLTSEQLNDTLSGYCVIQVTSYNSSTHKISGIFEGVLVDTLAATPDVEISEGTFSNVTIN